MRQPLRRLVAWVIDYVLVSMGAGLVGLLTIGPAIEHGGLASFVLAAAVVVAIFAIAWKMLGAQRAWSLGARLARLERRGRRP